MERIKLLALSLMAEERQALARYLAESANAQQPPQKPQSTRGSDGDKQIRERRVEWLKSHREEYAGQYVALAGDVLVRHGATIREAREQAEQQGVENSFLVRLISGSEVLFTGS